MAPSDHSWEPTMTEKTTTFAYWWNWRVLLCAVGIFSSMIVASLLIWKFEGPEEREGQDNKGTLYDDESWRPCIKQIHPLWLLLYRVLSFFFLAFLLTVYVVMHGPNSFYYYTQWTFILVVFYFGFGSMLSISGCYRYFNGIDCDSLGTTRFDNERGTYIAPSSNEHIDTLFNTMKRSDGNEERQTRRIAGIWGYVFQIIYQTNAGAVMLTDCIFWTIIAPFLEQKDYELTILNIGMHSVNAVFLLGDTALNSLRFPWFRISYFLLWTSLFVLFQWMVHACISIWWPYPFLDLSSNYAPIWYLAVGLMHVPCYAFYYSIIRFKNSLLLKWFPSSHGQ